MRVLSCRQASTAAAAPAKPAPKPAESAAEKAAKAAKAAAALERDRQSQKDWMRRYMEQQSESEEDDDGKVHRRACSAQLMTILWEMLCNTSMWTH